MSIEIRRSEDSFDSTSQNITPVFCFNAKRTFLLGVRSQHWDWERTPVPASGPPTKRGILGALLAPASQQGGQTVMRKLHHIGLLIALVCLATGVARGQSFRVQCPTSTLTHPVAANNNLEPAYTGPTVLASGNKGYLAPSSNVNGAIKCQQISGGDGYATMGDGTQTYMFSFGPLSGLADIANGLPGTKSPTDFNMVYAGATPLLPGDPATTVDTSNCTNAACIQAALVSFGYNGAVGQVPDRDNGGLIDGHVDPRPIMDVGVMNGNIPAPLMAIDEDDEFFLTLTNVGMIMRP